MILKALYDYYKRSSNLPQKGLELKEIGFIIVIDEKGNFVRFEDRRSADKKSASSFLVKKSVGRTVVPIPNYLYDNSAYVFNFSDKGDPDKVNQCYEKFKTMVLNICEKNQNIIELKALKGFYSQETSQLHARMQFDGLWQDIQKNLNKKYSNFSFLLEGGDGKIFAEKPELLDLVITNDAPLSENSKVCLVTGEKANTVEITTATMIPGSQATAKLVAFQVKSGYDSYGKEKGNNAPISEEAEFGYTTALNHMLKSGSRNRFNIANRTYVFWASSNSEASQATEDSLFNMIAGFDETDDPNRRIDLVKKTFLSIYNGELVSNKDDVFYILGLAPNSARIAVVYWAEIPLKEFSGTILKHFKDMEIVDGRKEKKNYLGIHSLLAAVTLGGKSSDATPNLPDALVKSIFQGISYPSTLFQSCIRRIRAENTVNITKAAIIKGYLNRLKENNNKKIQIMLDKENSNVGYICGRLFAVLDKIQYDANGISSIKERYMNSASATPSSVFPTILGLSVHHSEKLNKGAQIYYEKLKQEIMSRLGAEGFPSHLDLQDQGRFFVGYYHQRQDLFTSKETENKETEE